MGYWRVFVVAAAKLKKGNGERLFMAAVGAAAFRH